VRAANKPGRNCKLAAATDVRPGRREPSPHRVYASHSLMGRLRAFPHAGPKVAGCPARWMPELRLVAPRGGRRPGALSLRSRSGDWLPRGARVERGRMARPLSRTGPFPLPFACYTFTFSRAAAPGDRRACSPPNLPPLGDREKSWISARRAGAEASRPFGRREWHMGGLPPAEKPRVSRNLGLSGRKIPAGVVRFAVRFALCSGRGGRCHERRSRSAGCRAFPKPASRPVCPLILHLPPSSDNCPEPGRYLACETLQAAGAFDCGIFAKKLGLPYLPTGPPTRTGASSRWKPHIETCRLCGPRPGMALEEWGRSARRIATLSLLCGPLNSRRRLDLRRLVPARRAKAPAGRKNRAKVLPRCSTIRTNRRFVLFGAEPLGGNRASLEETRSAPGPSSAVRRGVRFEKPRKSRFFLRQRDEARAASLLREEQESRTMCPTLAIPEHTVAGPMPAGLP